MNQMNYLYPLDRSCEPFFAALRSFLYLASRRFNSSFGTERICFIALRNFSDGR